VPTTPTTAYAKAGSAVVDPDNPGRRLALFDPKTRAGALFLHPAAALSAPPDLALGAALNAFTMAVEGLLSRVRDPLADAALLHALRLLAGHLPLLAAAPGDADLRFQLMMAALLAGQGTDHTGSGLNAALTHPTGARLGGSNGIVGAVLLPATMRFNAPAAGERLALVAEALGAAGRDSEAAIASVDSFLARLGLPRRLAALGVAESDLPAIAAEAEADFFYHQNPRRIAAAAEVVEVLRSVL
jgi:alcohol dehydrogenase class IV